MVVMDDGWFGKRNDDNSSLGDWYVNEEKLGGTLTKLIERVNAEGVKFGIWIEPEMVSEDSDLYRNIRTGQSQFQAASLSVPETSWSLIFPEKKYVMRYLNASAQFWIREMWSTLNGI